MDEIQIINNEFFGAMAGDFPKGFYFSIWGADRQSAPRGDEVSKLKTKGRAVMIIENYLPDFSQSVYSALNSVQASKKRNYKNLWLRVKENKKTPDYSEDGNQNFREWAFNAEKRGAISGFSNSGNNYNSNDMSPQYIGMIQQNFTAQMEMQRNHFSDQMISSMKPPHSLNQNLVPVHY